LIPPRRTHVVIFLGAAATVFPQETLSTLEVTVRDGSALSPHRRVRLEGAAFVREAATDERGRVLFVHLRPGRFELVVIPQDGAGDARRCARVVDVDASTDASATLDCGSSGEKTSVDATPTREGTTVWPSRELTTLPRPTDPWSVLRDVPGVATDRVNVGGSETAQQSLLVSHGDSGLGATWTIDGFDVTDPAAPGFTSVYPDMDALESVVARTGAVDARVRTPGVQVALDFRAPTRRLSGRGHLRLAPSALQSDNLPDVLRARSFFRSTTEDVVELGAEAGGEAKPGRLWLWGAFHRNALRQLSFTEHEEDLRTTSFTGRARARLGGGAVSLLLLRAEKVHEERDPTLQAAPEARWKQTGPTFVASLEDARGLGGWSLLSRVGWMDGGFRLAPQGGSGQSAFEDVRGVAQRSYLTLETDRPRFQASAEAAKRLAAFGARHDLAMGMGYRWSRVSSDQSWPGNSTQGLERGGVFFRTFRLTGFALLYRGLSGRSVQDHLELWAQDTMRWDRLTLTLGARLDRLSGHNEASAVPASPEFPDLLPAVRYGGESPRFRWFDVLPRIGSTWQVNRSGSLVLGARYAAYGAPLGTGEVVFDNPLASLASLTYYWIDANADGTVSRGELDPTRGRIGASGLDPEAPSSPTSPQEVDPDLVSPRTHEAAGRIRWSRGERLEVVLEGGFRRQVRALWRPLRGLTRADYTATGAVSGELFGRPYLTVYYAPASPSRIAPGNGRILTNRDGYAEESLFLDFAARGRMGRRVDYRLWAGGLDWRERFTDAERAVQDPTSLDSEPVRDRGVAAARAGGLGRGDLFASARWTAGAAVRGRLPWGLEAAVVATARDGFPIPYIQVATTGDASGGAKDVLISPTFDAYRLPPLWLFDLRLARGFRVGRGTLTLQADVFNATNRSTTLQVVRDIELPNFDRPREIVRPRIVRLGLDYRF
jgi:hypothetical protein